MRRLISGAVHNPVAANLLMVVIIVVGGMSAYNLRRETFPRISFDTIQVQTLFPGATPEEVEESIVVKVEEAIKSVEGIQDITSQAREGSGVVLARLKPGMDNRRVLEDIQSEVEKIDTFPDDAEPTRFAELKERRKVINVAIHGEQPERTLKEVASRVRDDLLASEFISQVRLIGTRDYEISIEVSEASLRRHGLTFDEIRQVVQRSSLNLPGGSIKTPAQDIVVRTAGQRYTGLEFALLPLLTRPDGTVITLDEVARVSDGFVDAWRIGRFNGAPSVLVSLFRTSEEDALVISDTVRRYVAEQAPRLPAGLSMSVWADDSAIIRSRLELLSRNGLQGLFLVLLSLWLFMNLRLALWVGVGLVVALLGGLWILFLYGGTLNMITMFAFIMALGMLVDDAIVVGENIYSHWRGGKAPVRAAIDGAGEVALPVIGAVSTTMAAFMPLFIMEGVMGKFISRDARCRGGGAARFPAGVHGDPAAAPGARPAAGRLSGAQTGRWPPGATRPGRHRWRPRLVYRARLHARAAARHVVAPGCRRFRGGRSVADGWPAAGRPSQLRAIPRPRYRHRDRPPHHAAGHAAGADGGRHGAP